MMKKNGFSFIETVVTVVILSASLLLIYNSYSSIINNEQQRIYYNDPAYIYRSISVLNFMNYNSVIMKNIKNDFSASSKYVQQIGVNYEDMFETDEQKNDVEQLLNTFNINQIFIIKSEFFDKCFISGISEDEKLKCDNAFNELNSAMKFVQTISNQQDIDYYFVVEYSEMSKILGSEIGKLTKCFMSTEQKYGCHYYYAYIPIERAYLS